MVGGKYLLPFRAQKKNCMILCRNNFLAIGFWVTGILLYICMQCNWCCSCFYNLCWTQYECLDSYIYILFVSPVNVTPAIVLQLDRCSKIFDWSISRWEHSHSYNPQACTYDWDRGNAHWACIVLHIYMHRFMFPPSQPWWWLVNRIFHNALTSC